MSTTASNTPGWPAAARSANISSWRPSKAHPFDRFVLKIGGSLRRRYALLALHYIIATERKDAWRQQ